ncbi:hypothetical protein RIR_jg4614.t1 [Rhizophagus irregularis DAOM 181602=DAOM 197198]|nr:hypothetical protein RIR_jg4614.t1 [Rhizophagus irregularis DAOM 181602=DAOM 197198]
MVETRNLILFSSYFRSVSFFGHLPKNDKQQYNGSNNYLNKTMALALLDAKKINYWKVRIPNAGGYHEVDETFILSKITRKSIQTDMLESDLMNTDFTIYLLHPKKSDTKFFKKYVSNQLEMCTISVKSGMELEIVKLGELKSNQAWVNV